MPRDDSKLKKLAEALLLMAEAAGRVSEIESDLQAMSKAVNENPELLRFLADHFVATEGKQAAISELFSGRADPLLVIFMRILQFEKEIVHLDFIHEHFASLVDARRHRASGELLSAVPLPEDRVAAIEKQASRILGKKVFLKPSVDSEMLGGIMIRVGDFVIDGTLDTELSRARTSLSG